LGLAIVKHVLNRHEAQLTITSEEGAGSRFICSFPGDMVLDKASVELSADGLESA
jgi:two-component system phosphate regulon sensor histidine kinase PhoR